MADVKFCPCCGQPVREDPITGMLTHIPQTNYPVEAIDNGWGRPLAICPECGNTNLIVDNIYIKCSKCGQLIDFSRYFKEREIND